jgi:hypothetical protein
MGARGALTLTDKFPVGVFDEIADDLDKPGGGCDIEWIAVSGAVSTLNKVHRRRKGVSSGSPFVRRLVEIPDNRVAAILTENW